MTTDHTPLWQRVVKTRDEIAGQARRMLDTAANENRALTPAERSEHDDLLADLEALNQRVSHLREEDERRARAAAIVPESWGGQEIRVTSEASTYRADNQRSASFFADMVMAERGDYAARDRIERHRSEHRDLASDSFNGLIPPQYLLDRVAEYARAHRPFADAVPGYTLPDHGMSLIVTKVTSGSATGVQTAENQPATETDLATTDITIPVVTIMGQQDLSRQSIERGQISDEVVFRDLLADYSTRLDLQCLRGSGSNGESTGILTAATQTQTWTGTTVASFISKVIGAADLVASNRYAAATTIVMHPRRWHWLMAQSDDNGRPIVEPYAGAASSPSGLGGTGYGAGIGSLIGLPVVVDANVGTNHGASTNEDRVIVTRMPDISLWENGVQSFRFDQATGAPETIRLAVHGYHGFDATRYTTATAVVVGSGLVAPVW